MEVKPLDEATGFVQWFQSLQLEESRVTLVLMNGLAALAGFDQQRDETMLRLVVRRVYRRPAFSDVDRAGVIAGRVPHVDDLSRRLSERSRVLRPPPVDPLFPRLRVEQMYTIEKWSLVQPNGAFGVTARYGLGEEVRVGDNLGADDELKTAGVDPRSRSRRLLQVIETLSERMARALRVALGPEQRSEEVARDTTLNR